MANILNRDKEEVITEFMNVIEDEQARHPPECGCSQVDVRKQAEDMYRYIINALNGRYRYAEQL